MGKHKNKKQGFDLWRKESVNPLPQRDISAIIGSVKNLPVQYWTERMFFKGAKDVILYNLTEGVFPRTVKPEGTHPLFVQGKLPNGIGAMVSPCTSKRPYEKIRFIQIKKGCTLKKKNTIMDRNSYALIDIRINIPRDLAFSIRFMGEIPIDCMESFFID